MVSTVAMSSAMNSGRRRRRSFIGNQLYPDAGRESRSTLSTQYSAERFGIDVMPRKRSPGEHRDGGLDDRDRITMGERDRGVEERFHQRTDLLECCGDLRTQRRGRVGTSAPSTSSSGARSAPADRARGSSRARRVRVRATRERVGRRVHIEELYFFLDRGGEAIVHVLGQRRHRRFGSVILGAPPPARIDPVHIRAIAMERERFLALPVRQRPEPGVGREQVDEVGRTGAGEADDDQRTLDLHGVDLGVTPDQVSQQQTAGEEAQHAAPQDQAPQVGEIPVALDRGQVGP